MLELMPEAHVQGHLDFHVQVPVLLTGAVLDHLLCPVQCAAVTVLTALSVSSLVWPAQMVSQGCQIQKTDDPLKQVTECV